MNIRELLDIESPEINSALQCGFRRGDIDTVGRALLEEIKTRKKIARALDDRMRSIEASPINPTNTDKVNADVTRQINDQTEKIRVLESNLEDANTRLDALIAGLTLMLASLSEAGNTLIE